MVKHIIQNHHDRYREYFNELLQWQKWMELNSEVGIYSQGASGGWMGGQFLKENIKTKGVLATLT